MSLQHQINDFMERCYGDLPLYNIRDPKIIHMTKLGTHRFFAHEIATIDTPIVQRLKYISQLGPVYNVFPTARHTRFEHTLGVVVSVTNMWKSISENGSLSFLNVDEKNDILTNLRLAAILHDIGHCLFSHVSEAVLEDFPVMGSEMKRLKSNPHEILSYHILRSDPVRAFFDSLSKEYDIRVDIEEISNYIIGRASVENQAEDQYIADMINGQIDADKLDYIVRDSEFSGVPFSVGIDRLLLSLGVGEIDTPSGPLRKLIIHEKGIMAMEQLILSKAMLFSAIYHHQKVRSLEYMITSILREIIDEEIAIGGTAITSPINLFKLDDYDLFKLESKNPRILDLCKRFKNRRIFKRSLVVSPKTVIDNKSFGFLELLKYSEYGAELRELNKILSERIGNGCTEFDVGIDLPKTPNLGETQDKIIETGNKYLSLKDIFPQKQWLEAYMANKWKGHISHIPRFELRNPEFSPVIIHNIF